MEIDVLNHIFLLWVKAWILFGVAMFLVGKSRNSSAGTLHAILFVVLLGVGVMPFLSEVMPVFHFAVLPVWAEWSLRPSFSQNDASFYFSVVGCFYIAIIFFLWVRRFLQVLHVVSLGACAKRLAISRHRQIVREISGIFYIQRNVDLRYSDYVRTPLTYGAVRPVIVMPRESLLWNHGRVRRFLLHEMAHISRHDWLAKLVGYGAAACFWIIPSAWSIQRKLEWLAELACDDKVIAVEGRRTDYADDLLALTNEIHHSMPGAVALTEARSHFDRISAVLDGTRIRQPSLAKFWLYSVVYCAVLIICSGLKLGPAPIVGTAEYDYYPLEIGSSQAGAVNDTTEETLDGDHYFLWEEYTVLPTPVVTGSLDIRPSSFNVPENTFDGSIKVEKIGTNLSPIIKVIPDYPPAALRKRREGVVKLMFAVLPDGRTTNVKIVHADPTGIFDKAAMDAIRQYRFSPQTRTVEGMTEIFKFKID